VPVDTGHPVGSVLRYGADPSGVTCSYQALHDLCTVTNEVGGGDLLFPPGTYLVDKVRDIDEYDVFQNGSNIRSMIYRNCSGLRISGFGAKIDIKGDAVVDNDYFGSSDVKMVGAFQFNLCRNVVLEGFEIDGNVQDLSGDSWVEGDSYLVAINGSTNVTVRNCWIHHAWTDNINIARNQGYLVGEGSEFRDTASRQVIVENCEISFAGRANFGAHEYRCLTIRSCRVHGGGNHEGTKFYSPRCNFDWEPDVSRTGDVSDQGYHSDQPPAGSSQNTNVSNILTSIEMSEFYNAGLRNIVSVRKTSHMHVKQCFLDNEINDQQPLGFSIPFAKLTDNIIDIRGGRLDISLTGGVEGIGQFTMRDNEVRARARPDGKRGAALFWAGDNGFQTQVMIENNRFIDESTGPRDDEFITLSHGDGNSGNPLQATFRDNYVFIPAASYSGTTQDIAVTMHVQMAENNVYQTDRDSTTEFLGVHYIAGTSNPGYHVIARNERFLAAGVAGTNQAIRAADNSAFDLTDPWAMGE